MNCAFALHRPKPFLSLHFSAYQFASRFACFAHSKLRRPFFGSWSLLALSADFTLVCAFCRAATLALAYCTFLRPSAVLRSVHLYVLPQRTVHFIVIPSYLHSTDSRCILLYLWPCQLHSRYTSLYFFALPLLVFFPSFASSPVDEHSSGSAAPNMWTSVSFHVCVALRGPSSPSSPSLFFLSPTRRRTFLGPAALDMWT